jgi:hypothetical protein
LIKFTLEFSIILSISVFVFFGSRISVSFFYDLCCFVELLVLLIFCGPDFIELYLFSCNLLSYFLKIILNSLAIHTSPVLWDWILVIMFPYYCHASLVFHIPYSARLSPFMFEDGIPPFQTSRTIVGRERPSSMGGDESATWVKYMTASGSDMSGDTSSRKHRGLVWWTPGHTCGYGGSHSLVSGRSSFRKYLIL